MHSSGKIDIAVTRTNKQNKSSFGKIGRVQHVTIDNVSGKREGVVSKILNLSISDVRVISADESEIPVCTEGDSVVVYQKTNGVNEWTMDPEKIGRQWTIYPNPTDGRLTLTLYDGEGSSDKKIVNYQLSIINLLGEIVYQSEIRNPKSEINLKEVPKGLYFLQLQTADGIYYKKLLKE